MNDKFKTVRINITANGYIAYTSDNDFGCTRSDADTFVFTSPATLAAWLEKNIAVPAARCADADAVGCCGGPKQADYPKGEAARHVVRGCETVTVDDNVRRAVRLAVSAAEQAMVERDPATSREENARKFHASEEKLKEHIEDEQAAVDCGKAVPIPGV